MCKPQRTPTALFAALLLACLAACPARGRGARAGEGIPGVGERGGRWPGGIGAVLRFRETEGALVVHRAPEGGAAADAGLREGDAIVAIDGEPVRGRDRAAVVERLRGEVGTRVVLRVRRGAEERDVTVERAPYRRAGGD